MQTINTKYGSYTFEPKVFTIGTKVIDKRIAKENLILFKKIMDKNNVPFSLAYGTLLGAIRENDFIEHDEDTDVAIMKEDEKDFFSILFELKENGFDVGRYANDLISVIRKGEYIDIYIFKKSLGGYRKFGKEVLKEKYLTKTIDYCFQGHVFKVPEDFIGYLKDHYGEDWEIPIKNFHALNPGIYLSIRNYMKNNFFILYKFIISTKNIYIRYFRKKNNIL